MKQGKKKDKHFQKFIHSHDPDEMLREIKHAPHFGRAESSGSSHIGIFITILIMGMLFTALMFAS
jgi:hypothetical protein